MWNATYSVPSVHHASSRRALVSMPNALMAWSTVSATFCVLLIFTIKLTLALGGCRSALSPEDARVRTVRPPQMQSRDGSGVAPYVHTLAPPASGPTPFAGGPPPASRISGITKGSAMTTFHGPTHDTSAPTMARVGEFTADGL